MVQIQVMTITGKVVWTKNQIISTEGFYQKRLHGTKDDFGNKIGKGVYVHKQSNPPSPIIKEQKSLKTCDIIIHYICSMNFLYQNEKINTFTSCLLAVSLQMLKIE
jgi:hypothetical protein